MMTKEASEEEKLVWKRERAFQAEQTEAQAANHKI